MRQAVENCRREQLISAEAVIQRTRTLAACDSQTRRSSSWTTELTTAPQVSVPLPDLSRFNHLLDGPASSEDPTTKGSPSLPTKAPVREPSHRVRHLRSANRRVPDSTGESGQPCWTFP